MGRPEVRIYRSRRPLKTALTVFFVLLAALIALAFAIFFGFKKYIVYTSDGVKLEVPWLQDPADIDSPALPTQPSQVPSESSQAPAQPSDTQAEPTAESSAPPAQPSDTQAPIDTHPGISEPEVTG